MASKEELSVSITNKNALKDKIHEIHNFIRNSGAGYGTTALKIFNLIYGLKRIEEFNLIDKLKPEYKYVINNKRINNISPVAFFYNNNTNNITQHKPLHVR